MEMTFVGMYADKSPAWVSMIGSAVKRAAAELASHLCCALQEARVQIEHVAGVRFTARRAPQQERNFPVGLRVLREVVVDAQRMAAAVAEELPHRARGIRRDIQKRRRIRRAGRNDNAVAERIRLFENADDLRDGRLLLTDRVVNADDVLVALIDDGVDRHRGLACLTVADDQLALTAADGHHRVDGFESRSAAALERAGDRRRPGAMRSIGMNVLVPIGPLPSMGCPSALTTRPSSSSPTGTEMMRPVRLTMSPSLISVYSPRSTAPTRILFEVEGDAEDAVRKLEHLAGHGSFDTVHARDSVAERHDAADFGHVDLDGVAADLIADDLGNFFRFDLHIMSSIFL